jgi:hypothetical protein
MWSGIPNAPISIRLHWPERLGKEADKTGNIYVRCAIRSNPSRSDDVTVAAGLNPRKVEAIVPVRRVATTESMGVYAAASHLFKRRSATHTSSISAVRGMNPTVTIVASLRDTLRRTHHFLAFRYRRIKAFVELSCPNSGSVAASNSGTIRWASTLPSSTPHWSNESMFQITPCVKTLCS